MTFKEIQDAVLADTFDETKRTSAKFWINNKYTWLCDLDDWAFMDATSTVTVTANSSAVTGLPTDFVIANALLDQYGNALEPIQDAEDYYFRYVNPTTPTTGQPEAFTVIGNSTILVGPTSNVSSTAFRLVYERVAALLSADGDTPIIPSGHHMALVFGARALGCRLSGMFSEAADADNEFRGAVEALRAKYKRSLRDRNGQSPAYRPC